jgi:hypothetical protein
MNAGINFRAGVGIIKEEPIQSLVPSLVPQPNLGLRNFFGICKVLILNYAPVAQLDRAFDYESKGRKFESCRAHFKPFNPLNFPFQFNS